MYTVQKNSQKLPQPIKYVWHHNAISY